LRGNARAEFAGGEGVHGAEAAGKLGVGQEALAMEPPKKIGGGEVAFLDVAFLAAGNEVAAGIVAELGTGDDVIEAASKGGKAAETIKATAAFSRMDGAAQSGMFQEVQIIEIEGASAA
jgi:hypothetical protein